eukprot:3500844-Alexandrium_andersonii.AAC.1
MGARVDSSAQCLLPDLQGGLTPTEPSVSRFSLFGIWLERWMGKLTLYPRLFAGFSETRSARVVHSWAGPEHSFGRK